MPDFTDEQVGKRVVDQNGIVVGKVTGIRDGSLLVTVDADADDQTIQELNWDGVVDQENHSLNDRHISTIREDTVRLRV